MKSLQLRFTRSRSVTKYRLMQERFEPTTTQFRLVDAANRTDPSDGGGINSTSTYLNFCHNFTIYPLLLFFFCSPTFCHVYGIAFCDLQLGFQKLKQGGVITNSTWHTIKDWKNYVMGQTCWKFGKPFSTAKEKLNFLHKLSYFIIKN